MTAEDALYYKILLLSGYSPDVFSDKLNEDLEREDPLSDITLALSFCKGNTDEIISCLNSFCRVNPPDPYEVCGRLRTLVRDEYLSGETSEKEAVDDLHLFALCSEAPSQPPWCQMEDVANMYELAEFQDIDPAVFTEKFLSYIHDGTPVDIFPILQSRKPSRFSQIKAAIKRLFGR